MNTELPNTVAPIWTVNTKNRRNWVSIIAPVQNRMTAQSRVPYTNEELAIMAVIRDRQTFGVIDWEWINVDDDGLWEFANGRDLHLSKEAIKAVQQAIHFVRHDQVIREPILSLDVLELIWKYTVPGNKKSGVYLGGLSQYAFNPETAKEKGYIMGWDTPIGHWLIPPSKKGDDFYHPRLYWAFNYLNLMRQHLDKTAYSPPPASDKYIAFTERFVPMMPPDTGYQENDDVPDV